MTRALVNRIIDSSVVDGPGNRTAIFLQGCNFACAYCHNPETIRVCNDCGDCIRVCPAHALVHEAGRVVWNESACVGCDACLRRCAHGSSPKARWFSAEEAGARVQKNLPFIRGVTLSGGECTLQIAFVRELFAMTAGLGLTNWIDSNGSYLFEEDAALMAVCDGVALDVKAYDPVVHRRVTGRGNEAVLRNLDYLAAAGKLAEVRTVVTGGDSGSMETVRGVSQRLARLGRADVPYRLIRYRPFGVREPFRSQLRPPNAREMDVLQRLAQDVGLRCVSLV